MATFNLLVFLNAYSDSQSSNNPSQNNFKWTNNINGLSVDKPISSAFSLAPGESKTLFDGSRTLTQDGTTQYSLTLKPLTTSTYILSWSGGTSPTFRTQRDTGQDASTQISITVNGPLATITSTGGTLWNLIDTQVGDLIRLSTNFNTSNRGEYRILALTSTSVTVENEFAVIEGPITLGSGFNTQLQIYGTAGVQIGDTLKINGGFSPVIWGSYPITDVAGSFIEFSSLDILPQQLNILTEAVFIYSDAKQLIYLESDQNVDLTINGVASGSIEPFVNVGKNSPGMFIRKSTIYSLTVTNSGSTSANLFFAAVA
jgi:hypothetical protein